MARKATRSRVTTAKNPDDMVYKFGEKPKGPTTAPSEPQADPWPFAFDPRMAALTGHPDATTQAQPCWPAAGATGWLAEGNHDFDAIGKRKDQSKNRGAERPHLTFGIVSEAAAQLAYVRPSLELDRMAGRHVSISRVKVA